MKEKPIIGVTKPGGAGFWPYTLFAAAVKLAGGEPVPITPKTRRRNRGVHGVIVGGGNDIFPMLYDSTPKQGYVYDRERDAMEIDIIEQAEIDDIPTLGVCRGAQIMNVVRGGSLHADVTAEYDDDAYPNGLWDKVFYRKTIRITAESMLASIFDKEKTQVNSLHKQAVKTLGENLAASAQETNGVIQAIEDNRCAFFIGVQFHPEMLLHRSDMRRLFGRLVAHAGEKESVSIAGG